MNPSEIAHYAWWSKPKTVIRTQAQAELVISQCLVCQRIAEKLRKALYGRRR